MKSLLTDLDPAEAETERFATVTRFCFRDHG
jgi:hypothetical protein